MARNCRFAVAVHICAVLALQDDKPATSEWIASSVNTNPVVVRRLLSILAKAGMVSSLRGIAGGSRLAKTPQAITTLDIYRAVGEGDGFSLHHQPPNPACPVGANILPVLTTVFDRAERAKEAELAKTTLADIVADIKARMAA